MDKLDDFTIAVFGECGQGKSTLLNTVSDYYSDKFNKFGIPINFVAGKSLTSVTSHVSISTNGNMSLIDTPGFNDPNKTRTDKSIFLDLINTIREPLKSSHQGLSMFVQCIMPDESDRIRKSAIKSMMNLLLIFAVFHRETTIDQLEKCHPTMAVVFNHVSKYENATLFYERIDKFKDLLKEDAVEFYCHEISDETIIDGK